MTRECDQPFRRRGNVGRGRGHQGQGTGPTYGGMPAVRQVAASKGRGGEGRTPQQQRLDGMNRRYPRRRFGSAG